MKRYCIGKPSAKFVAKLEDVLDVYQRPYDPARSVVCLDECGKELHATPHGELPAAPGQTACQAYEYERHGTRNLFLAVEPLRGLAQGACDRTAHSGRYGRAAVPIGGRRLPEVGADCAGDRTT